MTHRPRVAAVIWRRNDRNTLEFLLVRTTTGHRWTFPKGGVEPQDASPAEAARHPAAHALTRAIGASEELKLEILELDVLPGDAFLLCSDGLYQGLSADALGAALNLPSPLLALNRLFQQALDGPARDNLSAVVIRR